MHLPLYVTDEGPACTWMVTDLDAQCMGCGAGGRSAGGRGLYLDGIAFFGAGAGQECATKMLVLITLVSYLAAGSPTGQGVLQPAEEHSATKSSHVAHASAEPPWQDAWCKNGMGGDQWTGYCPDPLSNEKCTDPTGSPVWCDNCLKKRFDELCCPLGNADHLWDAGVKCGLKEAIELASSEYDLPTTFNVSEIVQCGVTGCEASAAFSAGTLPYPKKKSVGQSCKSDSECASTNSCCSADEMCDFFSNTSNCKCVDRVTCWYKPSDFGSSTCFDKASTTACHLASPTAECNHVLMADLAVGDLVLGREGATTVLAVQHKAVDTRADMITLHTADGGVLSLTHDHALFVDGVLRAAREAKVGATLTNALGQPTRIKRIVKGEGLIVNAVTCDGTIVANGLLAASNPLSIASLTVDKPLLRAVVNAVIFVAGDVDSVASGAATVAATLAFAALAANALCTRASRGR